MDGRNVFISKQTGLTRFKQSRFCILYLLPLNGTCAYLPTLAHTHTHIQVSADVPASLRELWNAFSTGARSSRESLASAWCLHCLCAISCEHIVAWHSVLCACACVSKSGITACQTHGRTRERRRFMRTMWWCVAAWGSGRAAADDDGDSADRAHYAPGGDALWLRGKMWKRRRMTPPLLLFDGCCPVSVGLAHIVNAKKKRDQSISRAHSAAPRRKV